MKGSRGKALGRTAWLLALSLVIFYGTDCRGEDPSGRKVSAGTEKAAPALGKQAPKEPAAVPSNPRVRMKTSAGEIVLELDAKNAPGSVQNFLGYVKDGSYNGTIFHRVIPGFMIQGGGFEPGMKEKPTRAPIPNEAHNGLKNSKGTLAMARTSNVDSATNQFFINCNDNAFLDHKGKDPKNYGYAVFGRVVEGMGVVEKIEQVPTGTKGPFGDVPREDVLIESVTVITP
jgi:cyclophilin family peptidyl-prolyl cis-trans isomerase